MVKHWTVEIMGEQVLAIGDDELHAKRLAARRYFDLYPEKIGQAQVLKHPCQWGGNCPEGVNNCGQCPDFSVD
jgi:hypothetical protein